MLRSCPNPPAVWVYVDQSSESPADVCRISSFIKEIRVVQVLPSVCHSSEL